MSVTRYTLVALATVLVMLASGCGTGNSTTPTAQPTHSDPGDSTLADSSGDDSETPTEPTASLDGFWKVSYFEPDDQGAQIDTLQIFAGGEHYIYRPDSGELEHSAHVEIDTTQTPAHITLTAVREVEGVGPWPGVYHATSDQLVIRLGEIDGRRPVKLKGKGGVLISAERTVPPVAYGPLQEWTIGEEQLTARVVAYGREDFGVLLETAEGEMHFAPYASLSLAGKQQLDEQYGLALAAPGEFQLDPAAQAKALDSLRQAIPAEADVATNESGAVVQVRLVSHSFDDNAFNAIAQLAHLEQLSLSTELGETKTPGQPITAAGLKKLQRLRNLEELTLNATQIDLEGLTHLTALQQLSVLRMQSPAGAESQVHLNAEAVQRLTNLTTLQELELRGVFLDADCLEPLDRMISLNTLTLRPGGEATYSEKTIRALEFCEPLRNLEIAFSSAKDAEVLSSFKQLDTLTVVLPANAKGAKALSEQLTTALPRTKLTVVTQ